MSRPRILLFSNWFAPGFKGGGSQLAIINLVHALRDEFEFWVVSRDRDVGDSHPYAGTQINTWIQKDQFHVRYQSPEEQGYFAIAEIIRSTPHELVHLNSVVSIPFAAEPLVFRRTQPREIPVLISPHGEMSPRARAEKPLRKSIYLGVTRATRLFADAHWHAASPMEERDIKEVWGADASVMVAPILPPSSVVLAKVWTRSLKTAGALRCVFLSRIDRMKNLDLAIDLISATPNATLDIYGPVGQPDYWAVCMARIAESKYSDAFRYRGSVSSDKVIETLAQYDLLVQPSRSENFGYTILESLSAGCPVLISDQTPWRALESAGIGFDLPLGKPQQFRDALVQMRDLDESTHSAWRERARSYAQTYISTSPAKVATREMYSALLHRR
jgi:glycosyltransferase involved in cell wall biosynthesis